MKHQILILMVHEVKLSQFAEHRQGACTGCVSKFQSWLHDISNAWVKTRSSPELWESSSGKTVHLQLVSVSLSQRTEVFPMFPCSDNTHAINISSGTQIYSYLYLSNGTHCPGHPLTDQELFLEPFSSGRFLAKYWLQRIILYQPPEKDQR